MFIFSALSPSQFTPAVGKLWITLPGSPQTAVGTSFIRSCRTHCWFVCAFVLFPSFSWLRPHSPGFHLEISHPLLPERLTACGEDMCTFRLLCVARYFQPVSSFQLFVFLSNLVLCLAMYSIYEALNELNWTKYTLKHIIPTFDTY